MSEDGHELILKAVNYSRTPRPVEIRLNGMTTSGTAHVTTLSSGDLNAENSFEHPMAVSPEASSMAVMQGRVTAELRPYSVTVYRIPVQ